MYDGSWRIKGYSLRLIINIYNNQIRFLAETDFFVTKWTLLLLINYKQFWCDFKFN